MPFASDTRARSIEPDAGCKRSVERRVRSVSTIRGLCIEADPEGPGKRREQLSEGVSNCGTRIDDDSSRAPQTRPFAASYGTDLNLSRPMNGVEFSEFVDT